MFSTQNPSSDSLSVLNMHPFDKLGKVNYEYLCKNEEINLVDYIASTRGWLPLEVEETMTVSFNGKKYEITRK